MSSKPLKTKHVMLRYCSIVFVFLNYIINADAM